MSETNDVNALRKHLFDTIEGVKKGEIKIGEAKAISDLSQVIINTAKVEVEYAKVTGGVLTSSFLPDKSTVPATPGLIQHKIR